jgi:serine/threonine protein phosphatase PrpC
MRMFSFIAKIWREVSGQAHLEPEREPEQPSAAWIREHVHAAIGEEALQSNSDEIYQQWPLPVASRSSVPSVNIEPTKDLPPGQAGNVQTDMDKVFEGQEPKAPSPSLLVGWLSDPGIKRRNLPNEDSLFAAKGTRLHHTQPQPFGLFIVADGMGGYAHGQEASRLAIQIVIDRVLPHVPESDGLNEADFRKLLVEGVQAANLVIHERNLEQHMEMGTTITAALILGGTALVVNVGDSRTYLYRESGGLRKITRDHSLVAYLVETGIIKADDIYMHPRRNQIYRSLGTKPMVSVDAFTEQLQPGDTLLLCSDGLWEMVRDPLIQHLLRKEATPLQTSGALVEAALEGGGADNVSVIVAYTTGATAYREMIGLQLLSKPETVEIPDCYKASQSGHRNG